MGKVIFKHSEQAFLYSELLNALNLVCIDFGKDAMCSRGYSSLESQKATNAWVLQTRNGSYQTLDGAVYTGIGVNKKCWAAAYGCSKHCYCIAADFDGWMEILTNKQLEPYGLYKPMAHEPWHIELIKHKGISQAQKEEIRDSTLKGVVIDMDVKTFQSITGLTPDGIAGTKTKAKAKEVLQCCQEILGLNYKTAEEAINGCMTNPTIWLAMLKTVPYFKSFVLNIVDKMGGRK